MSDLIYSESYPYYLGTNAPYPFLSAKTSNPPEGYEPFFINHLSREGTSFLNNQEELDFLIYVLTINAMILNEEGNYLLSYLTSLKQLQKNQSGSSTGIYTGSDNSTVKEIARRMYENYPTVFGRRMYAVSTYVQSTIDTMLSFMEELFRYISTELALMSSGGRPDPLLRFFDLNIAYQKYKSLQWWVPLIEQYYDTSYQAAEIARFFFRKPLSQELTGEFVTALFHVLTASYAVTPSNISPLLDRYFTNTSKRHYWLYTNAYEFYEQGPSLPGITLTGDIAFPLLQDFIQSSIRAIESGSISANFRFAHANTLIPFVNLLKLGCCSRQTNYPPHIPYLWRNYEISPLAANISWIFYRHRLDDTILVKMTYNEQEILFPFYTEDVFVPWDKVRTFYLSLLHALPINRALPLVEQVSTYPSVLRTLYE